MRLGTCIPTGQKLSCLLFDQLVSDSRRLWLIPRVRNWENDSCLTSASVQCPNSEQSLYIPLYLSRGSFRLRNLTSRECLLTAIVLLGGAGSRTSYTCSLLSSGRWACEAIFGSMVPLPRKTQTRLMLTSFWLSRSPSLKQWKIMRWTNWHICQARKGGSMFAKSGAATSMFRNKVTWRRFRRLDSSSLGMLVKIIRKA